MSDDAQVSDLPLATALTGSELFYLVQGGTPKRATVDMVSPSQSIINIVSPPYNCVGDGTTDNSAGLQAAFNKAKALNGATVFVPAGDFAYATALALSGASGLTIQGISSTTQPTGGSALRYTGSGSAGATFTGCAGLRIKDLNWRYSNGAFAGSLLATPSSAGIHITDCGFLGVGTSSALYLLNFDGATDIQVTETIFDTAQYAILGQHPNGLSFCNAVELTGLRFASLTAGDIRNPGLGWAITGCDFEALAGLTGKAVKMDAGVTAIGVSITGCWFGDATVSSAWNWVDWIGDGLIFSGNYVNGEGTLASKGVKVLGVSSGITVCGNQFRTFGVGVDLGSLLSSNVLIAGNDYFNVTRAIDGTPAGSAILQSVRASLPFDIWASGARQLSMEGTTGKVTLNNDLQAALITAANGLSQTGGNITLAPPTSAPALMVNRQMSVTAPNNTTLTFSLRGSDGTTRSGSITLS